MRTSIASLLVLAATGTVAAHPHSSECTSTPVARPTATAELLRELQSAPTALDRARQLLVDGEALRTGDDLKSIVVFDFNGAQPASGAKGGVSKAAVSSHALCTRLDGPDTLRRRTAPPTPFLPASTSA
jgi:hypothetical protein